jgi:hypothetical protein
MHDSIRFHSGIKGNIFYFVATVSKSLIKICLENDVCLLLAFSIPSSPPIYIQDVTTIPPLLQLLEHVSPRKYETKALANNKVKVQPTTSDPYRAIIKALA